MSEPKTTIGIDLGTTYSCVAVWKNNKVEVIPNDIGDRLTPSVVSFSKEERLIGQAAKNQITKNYKNTIYDAKRLIGRSFNEETVQQDMKLWPFKISKDVNSERPVINVEYMNEEKQFLAEEISSMVLEKLKQCAEDYLGKKIEDAVITVPAYFNDSQRQATKDAGRIAGLNVKRIINEPTAAAIAYGFQNKKEGHILIFDLGGGTFDVSILELQNSIYEVKSTRGDTHLGGEDFDNILVNYCIDEFKKITEIDINGNQKALRRLKVACEKAKRDLSSAMQTSLDIDALAEGEDFNITITRPQFEELCDDSFNKCKNPLEEAIKDAGLTKNDIDDIVLVGGSTRIPKIQEIVKNFFDNKELNKTINPDEAVAIGAAIQGAIFDGVENDDLEQLVLLDVAPLSLGIETIGNKMSFVINRNSKIPYKTTKLYQTAYENQTIINFPVYQGENEFCKDNHFLGKFSLENIRKAPKGEVKVEVTFELDVDSILKVSGEEKGGNNDKGEITIKCENDRLSEDEIQKLMKNADKYREKDIMINRRIKAKSQLEKFVYTLKKKGNELSGNKRNKVLEKCDEVLNWVKNNNDVDSSLYENKLKEMELFNSNLL